MKKLLCICGVMFLMVTKLLGETFSTAEIGSTDFWVTFMQTDYDAPLELSLTFSAKKATTVHVTNEYTGYDQTILLGANDTQKLDVTQEKPSCYVSGPDAEIPVGKALHVTSDNNISVIAANYRNKSFDVAAILPTAALRSEYRIQCYPPTAQSDASQGTHFVIVAAEDDVEVDYTLSVNSNQHMAGQTYTTPKMKKGQAFYVWTGNGSGSNYDFSGTVVKARDNKKIAVFNGDVYTNIPNGIRDRDHIYSQAMPINYWGKHFAVTSSLTTIDGQSGNWERIDKVRIQSVVDSTIIYIDGDSVAMIDFSKDIHHTYEFDFGAKDAMTNYAGDGHRYFEGASHYIETSCPCAVHLFMTSNRYDHDKIKNVNTNYCNGDPSEIWVNPIEQTMTSMTFGNFETAQVKDHYVNIVTTTSGVGSMVLDGNSISSEFQPVNGNNEYSYARIKIPAQTHTMSGDEGFVAHVYGFGEKESYGYPIGCTSGVYYTTFVSGLCGDNLQWELDTITQTLTITGTGDMYDFTTTTTPWVGLQKHITQVVLPSELNSIGDYAFIGCQKLTSVTIPHSVTTIGGSAFEFCSSLTSITCYATTPPTCGSSCFYNVNKSIPVYVPAHSVDAYKQAYQWKDFTHLQANPDDFAVVTCNVIGYGTQTGADTYIKGDTCKLTITPDVGYQFTQWNDGNIENPRSFVVTQDTIFSAQIDTIWSGQCGDDLTWKYGDGVLVISGTGTMYDYTQDTAPWMPLFKESISSLVINNGCTSIGNFAFYGLSNKNLKTIDIPNSVEQIGQYAFANCEYLKNLYLGLSLEKIAANAFANDERLLHITCYATEPPLLDESAFVNYDAYLSVPCESQADYKVAKGWKKFNKENISCIGAEEKSVATDEVTVAPEANQATFTWPQNDQAAGYSIEITKDSVVFCTLKFNAQGQLIGIAFAPSRGGQAREMPAATMTANGWQFTVTGLNQASKYGYTLDAVNASQQSIKHYEGEFATDGYVGLPTLPYEEKDGLGSTKFIHNNQLLIRHNGNLYNAAGHKMR